MNNWLSSAVNELGNGLEETSRRKTVKEVTPVRWRVLGEEVGREGGVSGLEQVGEVLEHGHLVDEFVDVGDVRFRGQTDTREQRAGVAAVAIFTLN